jgi:prepilin-type N-terminal cleavage/methylation domain-containing protein
MNSRHAPRGFSLIEVLCAILVLGVGVVGLVQGVTTALGSAKEAEVQTAVALIAEGRLELLRAEGSLQAGERDGECPEALGPFRWREAVATTDLDGLYDVQIAIENTKSGQELYVLHTLLFDPPWRSSTETDVDQSGTRATRRRDAERR